MKRFAMPACLALCLLAAACDRETSGDAAPYEYAAGFRFIEVPDPLAGENPVHAEQRLPLPQIGVPFRDPSFSTRLTRVTAIDGINGRHEYSRFDPFNADKSMIVLLTESGEFAVYRTAAAPYNQPGNLVRRLGDLAEPRWDPADADRLWGLDGCEIVCWRMGAGLREVVKDFYEDAWIGPLLELEPDLYRVTTFDEGEPSQDFRYWALLLQGSAEDYRPRYLFCFDRQNDQITGLTRLGAEERAIDWVGMSPLGTWVLIGGLAENGGRFPGLTMADRGLGRLHRLDFTTAHADVGLDAAGSEVVVMQNTRTDYIDMLPLSERTLPILENGGSYSGSNRVRLVRLNYDSGSAAGCSSAVHISSNAAGYCLVSTTTGPNGAEKNWLDRCHVLVRLDGQRPRAFYLAKTYNTGETYFEETHGSLCRDGSRLVWATNWNRDPGDERLFLLQLDMPANWRALSGGG